jgi:hypothetical protein
MAMRFCALLLLLFAIGDVAHGATAREREAFEYLRTALSFDSPHVGIAGVHPHGYLALRIVNRSADADALFKRLIEEGSPAGQLYGLLGVYRTDRAYFRSVAPKFAPRTDEVSTTVGCIMSRQPVAEIVSVQHALVVLPNETLAEAVKRQPNGKETDISHGGYTAWYLGPDSNESEAMREEATVDFSKP